MTYCYRVIRQNLMQPPEMLCHSPRFIHSFIWKIYIAHFQERLLRDARYFLATSMPTVYTLLNMFSHVPISTHCLRTCLSISATVCVCITMSPPSTYHLR